MSAPKDENIDKETVEQVEEAVEAVEEAIEDSDLSRAENILRQLEQWKKDQSSTLEKAIPSALEPLLVQMKELREQVEKLQGQLKAAKEPNQKPPLKAPSLEEAPTPPMDTSQTEDPGSGGQEDQEEPRQPVSERQKRRWI